MSKVDKLTQRGLVSPPKHLKNNIHFEVMMGSIAYGCSNDASDVDLYGFSIPPKDVIFPHLKGYIPGFGTPVDKFEQYQQHHIKDKQNNKEYDITIYNIIKYFHLVMNNNPNMIDSLFVPRRCILHSTEVGEHVRSNRHLFLSKKSWHTFKGYAYSQLNKCKNKNIHHFIELCKELEIDYHISKEEFIENSNTYSNNLKDRFLALYVRVYQSGKPTKRIDSIAKYGYDVKFAYHIIRLLNEVEQILTEHNIDLERNREQLKSIRRGDWTLEEVERYFAEKELRLESVYISSTLRHKTNEESIKKLLMECLEMHYGNLSAAIHFPEKTLGDLNKASELIENVLRRMR